MCIGWFSQFHCFLTNVWDSILPEFVTIALGKMSKQCLIASSNLIVGVITTSLGIIPAFPPEPTLPHPPSLGAITDGPAP